MHHLESDLPLQKNRGDADAYGAERFAVKPESVFNVVNCRRAIHHLHLLWKAGAEHLLEIRARRNKFADHAGIGMKQSFAVGANERRIHHEDPTAPRRLQHVVEVDVGLKILNQCAPDRNRVVGVNAGAAEIGQVVFRRVCQLVGQLLCGLAGGVELEPEDLRNIKVGEGSQHHRDHKSDGQNDDVFSAQHKKVRTSYILRQLLGASSLATVASALAFPYSLSLLCRVFRLMPRISAARVLLLLVASRVFRINIFSASSTVVPTPSRTASGSLADARSGAWPKPGGRCLVSTMPESQTITARSRVLRSSRTFPGQE